MQLWSIATSKYMLFQYEFRLNWDLKMSNFQRPDSCCRYLPSFARLELLKECQMEDLYGETHSETPPVFQK